MVAFVMFTEKDYKLGPVSWVIEEVINLSYPSVTTILRLETHCIGETKREEQWVSIVLSLCDNFFSYYKISLTYRKIFRVGIISNVN